jgi:Na+/proline symporter
VEGSRNRAGRQAHSLYFTLIPELGLLGIFVFLSFITLFYKNLFKIRTKFKNDSENSDYFGLANALIVGMSGFLISGVFISVLYYPIMWHLLAMAVVLINVALRAGLDQSKATRKKLRTLRKVTSGQ